MPTYYCRRNLWPDVQVKTETAAGYAFACYDCELREHGECIGYPCETPPGIENARLLTAAATGPIGQIIWRKARNDRTLQIMQRV